MPEGPELHLASRFINQVCKQRAFDRIQKSDISKNPVVDSNFGKFTISATSRGKELKLTLTECIDINPEFEDEKKNSPRYIDIVFTFGLAGKFDFQSASELEKHAHLNFFTCDNGPKMVLSYIDYMRFGKWTPNADFSFKERGPCVLFEYEKFRENVLQNIESSVFNKPICEVLLNQKYFNGIGNYLRAEILYRAKIPPFVSARSVLEPLLNKDMTVKSEVPDVLELCSILPNEVVQLEGSWYDANDRGDTSNAFNNWLQCYYQDGMSNVVDHNKRTVWYSGPLGPLAPKDGKVRGKTKKKSNKKEPVNSSGDSERPENKGKQSRKRHRGQSTVDDRVSDAGVKTNISSDQIVNGIQIRDSSLNGQCSGDSKRVKKELIETAVKGRMTRGKMKELVEQVNEASDKETSGQSRNKKHPKSSGMKRDIKTEVQAVDISRGNHTEMKARTKVHGRRKTPLNNDAVYLNSAVKRKGRKALRVTQNESKRRLSSS